MLLSVVSLLARALSPLALLERFDSDLASAWEPFLLLGEE